MTRISPDKRDSLISLVGQYRSRSYTGLSATPFSSEAWEMIEKALRAYAPSATEAPVAYRVWCKGRKFTRGIYERPSQEAFKCWKADGDEVEPLYAAPQASSRKQIPDEGKRPDGAAPSHERQINEAPQGDSAGESRSTLERAQGGQLPGNESGGKGKCGDSSVSRSAEYEPARVSPNEETCTYCGESYPKPISYHHSTEECHENEARNKATPPNVEAPNTSGVIDGDPWESARSWWQAASPYATPEALKEALAAMRPSVEETCPSCKGAGTIQGVEGRGPDDFGVMDFECAKCDGTGVVPAPPSTAQPNLARSPATGTPPRSASRVRQHRGRRGTEARQDAAPTPRTDALLSVKPGMWIDWRDRDFHELKLLSKALERELAEEKAGHEALRLLAQGWKEDADRLTRSSIERSGCPCTVEGIEPCSYACSCANPVMSGGCSRCALYGSLEQRQAAARRLSAPFSTRAITANGNDLSEEEIESWRKYLGDVTERGYSQPAGCNVLCDMALVALRSATRDTTEFATPISIAEMKSLEKELQNMAGSRWADLYDHVDVLSLAAKVVGAYIARADGGSAK